MAGPASYTLTCRPSGGTLPPPAARAARSATPRAAAPTPAGQPVPCPSGRPSFHVTGTYLGRRIDARFIACFSGQWDADQRWATLVPDNLARLRIHPDRGIGELTLGEPRSLVRGLLGPGRPGRARRAPLSDRSPGRIRLGTDVRCRLHDRLPRRPRDEDHVQQPRDRDRHDPARRRLRRAAPPPARLEPTHRRPVRERPALGDRGLRGRGLELRSRA